MNMFPPIFLICQNGRNDLIPSDTLIPCVNSDSHGWSGPLAWAEEFAAWGKMC